MDDRTDASELNNDARLTADAGPASSQPGGRVYQITVRGHLASDWSDWLDGLEMTSLDQGDTVLSGRIVDQAALMGILNKLHRLNITLLAVSRVDESKKLDTGGKNGEH